MMITLLLSREKCTQFMHTVEIVIVAIKYFTFQ